MLTDQHCVSGWNINDPFPKGPVGSSHLAVRIRGRRVLVGTHASSLKWIPITVGIACIAVVLPVTILLVSAWLLGWQLQVVQSGSMAPPYSVGSLLVVQPIDASDVEVGMAIVFEDPQTEGLFITHRVVGRSIRDLSPILDTGGCEPHSGPVSGRCKVHPRPRQMARGRPRIHSNVAKVAPFVPPPCRTAHALAWYA
jgi:signal peptidase I